MFSTPIYLFFLLSLRDVEVPMSRHRHSSSWLWASVAWGSGKANTLQAAYQTRFLDKESGSWKQTVKWRTVRKRFGTIQLLCLTASLLVWFGLHLDWLQLIISCCEHMIYNQNKAIWMGVFHLLLKQREWKYSHLYLITMCFGLSPVSRTVCSWHGEAFYPFSVL